MKTKFSCKTLLLLLALLSGGAHAAVFCVYDPLGVSGDYYSMARDYLIAARRWNVELTLRAYVDEAASVNDFRNGDCDMLNMVGFRAREFNKFTGTVDAAGAIENYAEMYDVIRILALPQLAKYMTSGPYEVAGVLPLGAAYPVVHDRALNTLSKAAGKRIAVLDIDKTQAMFVEQVGAIPVVCSIANLGQKFNSGAVDVVVAPMILYKALELEKGIGDKGGIIRRAAAQISMQFMIKRDRFPAGFGQASRAYMTSQVPHAMAIIRQTEADVDPHEWLYVLSSERAQFYKIVSDARAHLTRASFYDARMLAILKRVRCKDNPNDGECQQTEAE